MQLKAEAAWKEHKDMTLLLKVILSKHQMSKYSIRKIKENAFTLTRIEPLPFWLNIDKNAVRSFTMKKYFSCKKETIYAPTSFFALQVFSLLAIISISVKINFKHYHSVNVSTIFVRLSFFSYFLSLLTFYRCEPILWFQLTKRYKQDLWIWF